MVFHNIQILRGVAAILVLVCHTNLMVGPELFGGFFLIGWSGVHFFFVLSGFIIFYTNYRSCSSPSQFLPYLGKRLRRIYPVYWIYCIGALVVHFVIFQLSGWSLITWVDLNALEVVKSFSLWPIQSTKTIIPVAWTLTYEAFFYLMFGLFILLPKNVSLGLALVWVIVIVFSYFMAGREKTPLETLIVSELNLEFILGCLAGYLVKTKKHLFGKGWIRGFLVFGTLSLAFAWISEWKNLFVVSETTQLKFGLPFFFIVLGTALHEQASDSVSTFGVVKRFGIYLGDASYSIYLIHFIPIVILVALNSKLGLVSAWVEFALILIVVLVLGCLSFNMIERPLTKRLQISFAKQ